MDFGPLSCPDAQVRMCLWESGNLQTPTQSDEWALRSSTQDLNVFQQVTGDGGMSRGVGGEREREREKHHFGAEMERIDSVPPWGERHFLIPQPRFELRSVSEIKNVGGEQEGM